MAARRVWAVPAAKGRNCLVVVAQIWLGCVDGTWCSNAHGTGEEPVLALAYGLVRSVIPTLDWACSQCGQAEYGERVEIHYV